MDDSPNIHGGCRHSIGSIINLILQLGLLDVGLKRLNSKIVNCLSLERVCIKKCLRIEPPSLLFCPMTQEVKQHHGRMASKSQGIKAVGPVHNAQPQSCGSCSASLRDFQQSIFHLHFPISALTINLTLWTQKRWMPGIEITRLSTRPPQSTYDCGPILRQ